MADLSSLEQALRELTKELKSAQEPGVGTDAASGAGSTLDEFNKKKEAQAELTKDIEMELELQEKISKELQQNNELSKQERRDKKELLKLSKQRTKELKLQTKEAQKFLKTFQNLKAVGKAVKDGFLGVSSALSGVAKDFAEFDANVLTLDSAKQQAKNLDNLSATLARTSGFQQDFTKDIMATQRTLVALGATNEDVGNSFASLIGGMTDFSKISRDNQRELTRTITKFNKLGVATESSTKLLEFSTKALGQSTEQAMALEESLIETALAIGVGPQQMVDGFSQAAPKLAAHGQSMERVFKGLALQSKASGASVSELLSIAGGFDTFEDAARKTSQLNAMFGTQLNSVELLNASEEERIQILQESLAAAGKSVDQMGRFELKSIAQTLGVSVDSVLKSFGVAGDELEDLQTKAKAGADIDAQLSKTIKLEDQLAASREASKNAMMGKDGKGGVLGAMRDLAKAQTSEEFLGGMTDAAKTMSSVYTYSMQQAQKGLGAANTLAKTVAGIDFAGKVAAPLTAAAGALMGIVGSMGTLLGIGGGGGMLGAAAMKLGPKLFGKTAAKTAAKTGTKKLAAKALGKTLLKKIPGIGLVAGLGFAASRLMKGDFIGAGGETLSGLASTIPGLGTGASIAIDAGLAARDASMANEPAAAPTAPAQLSAPSTPSTSAISTSSTAGNKIDAMADRISANIIKNFNPVINMTAYVGDKQTTVKLVKDALNSAFPLTTATAG